MSAGDIVINLFWDIQLIIGGIHAGRWADAVNETDGEETAGRLGAGREVHAVEITEGLDDAIVGLAVDHGNDLGPAGDAIDQHAAVIATGRHAGREIGHPGIQAGRGDGLIAALARAEDDHALAIPFRLGREDVDAADKA